MPFHQQQAATLSRLALVVLPLLVTAGSLQAAETYPACPPRPIRVVHSVGAPTTYTGVYPGVPEVRHLGPIGAGGYFYYGVWNMDWPSSGAAFPALKTAINGPVGTRASGLMRS